MDIFYYCVIDSQGFYVTRVLSIFNDGTNENEIQSYQLKKGQSLIDASVPNGLTKPKWNGNMWEETATPTEIEAAKPETILIIPTLDQRLQATEQALLTLMMGEQ